MELSISELATFLGGEVIGDGTVKVRTLAKIQEAEEGTVAFLSNLKYENFLYETRASVVIINHDFVPKREVKCALIKVPDAYSAFSRLLSEFQQQGHKHKTGIEQPSFISESAQVAEGVYVGAFAYLGENVTIGQNSKIYPHVYLGDGVIIGENTILYPGVKVYAGCQIGSHCTLHAGVVIGSDGFGFAPQPDGSYQAIPQNGNVIIEDHVDIGANTTIDCATMGSTIIRKGVKLDNLIQIAHNCEVGENTVMASQVGVSGSTRIGKNCVIAGQAGLSGHINIPDKTTIGPQAGIASAPDGPGATVVGSPAIDLKQYFKAYAVFRKLPEINRQINQMSNDLNKLLPKEE